MKYFSPLILLISILVSCKNGQKIDPVNSPDFENYDTSKVKSSFFPVTSFIEGQIVDLKNMGKNPMKIVSTDNHFDTSWVNVSSFEQVFFDYTHPSIDSVNYSTLFEEKKFLDQSIGLVTFTYDPIKTTKDTIVWKHWDVYVNPENNKVSRIYLVKNYAKNKIKQLTWLPGKSCREIVINELPDGKSIIESDITLKWDY